MQRPPAFQFHVHDYRSSRAVQRMTYSQRGMYLEMLCEQWDKGSLPDCPQACAELLGGTPEEWTANWPALRRNFVDRRNRPRDPHANPIPTDHNPARQIVNLRLERYRRSLRAFKKERSEAGKKGGRAKALKTKENGAGLATANSGSALAKPGFVSVSQTVPVSVPQTARSRARRKGHDAHAFCGTNFCVSHLQHELLVRNLGSARETFDLLAAYGRWDGLNDPIDNLLPWLKAHIASEIQADRPQVSKLSVALTKAGQW